MSKAMDALEYIKQRIAWCPEHEKCPSCRDTESNLALLRDYITTTEAREAAWAIALAGEQLAHETDLTQSAARIKELEEALELCLPHVQTDCWRFCEPEATVIVTKSKKDSQWDRVEPIARTKAKAALSGARKVNSLGSVCGDEHLGAMLPDDGARKVEK